MGSSKELLLNLGRKGITLKEIINKCLRPTATAPVVRFKNGMYQIGTHIPAKAYAEDPDTDQRCTVQGGIREGESVAEAMQRELAEEYGQAFADVCEVTVINMEPMPKRGRNGTFKLLHWCFIRVKDSDVEPIPGEEVYKFFWDDVTSESLEKVLGCMSQKRAETVDTLTSFLVEA